MIILGAKPGGWLLYYGGWNGDPRCRATALEPNFGNQTKKINVHLFLFKVFNTTWVPNSIVKCWKKCLFFGLKVAKKILIKGSAKMKSTSTPPTNELPKTLGQWVVASFEVEQSITTGNQAPRLRHATHHLCTRPTSPPQLSLSLSLFLSTRVA